MASGAAALAWETAVLTLLTCCIALWLPRVDGAATAAQVSLGSFAACAVRPNGQAVCWGDNFGGNCGQGHDTSPLVDVAAQPQINLGSAALTVSAVHQGKDPANGFLCLLRSDGGMVCAGSNTYGRLGQGNVDVLGNNEPFSSIPPLVFHGGASAVRRIVMGHDSCCAVRDAAGDMVCWGKNNNGQLGQGNTVALGDTEALATVPPIVFPDPTLQIAAAAMGIEYACALFANGAVLCWGQGDNGHLGTSSTANVGDTTNLATASYVDMPAAVVPDDIDCGDNHCCVHSTGNEIYCWGQGANGALGQGNSVDIGNDPFTAVMMLSAVQLPGGLSAKAVSCGGDESCAVLANDTVVCWGGNVGGYLGIGNMAAIGDDELPNVLSTLTFADGVNTVKQISTGSRGSCVLRTDDTVVCWGDADDGQIGQGNFDDIGDNESTAVLGPIDLPSIVVTSLLEATTAEAAGEVTMSVYLDPMPSGTVVLSVASGTPSAATVSPSSLTFTSMSFVAHTVTVTGVDDAVQSTRSSEISLAIASSADASFAGVAIPSLTVTLVDDDAPPPTIDGPSTTTGVVNEAAGTFALDYVLSASPSDDVTLAVSPSQVNRTFLPLIDLEFSSGTWSVPQTVTFTFSANAIDEPSDPSITFAAVSSSDDTVFNSLASTAATITITDDDVAGLSVVPVASTVDESVGATLLSYALDTQPTADVTVFLDETTLLGWIGSSSVTFSPANYATPVSVGIGRFDDFIDLPIDPSITVVHTLSSADPMYNALSTPNALVTVTDDDTASISGPFEPPGTIAEAYGEYTIAYVLGTEPTSPVTLSFSSNAAVLSFSSPTLDFDAVTWSSPATVTATAVPNNIDSVSDPVVTVTVLASSGDGQFNVLDPADTSVQVTDDDAASIAGPLPATVSVQEYAGTGTFTFFLLTEPTATVVVTSFSADPYEVYAQNSVTFSTTNYAIPQTVTIASENDYYAYDTTVTISHSVTSADPQYSGFSLAQVTVSVVDDEVASAIGPSTTAGTIAEAGGSVDVTFALGTMPMDPVTLTPLSGASHIVTVSPSTITFATGNYHLAQTIVAMAVADNVDIDGDATASVSFSFSSDDAAYDLLPVSALSVTVQDDDTRGILGFPAGTETVDENGPGLTYQLTLGSEPLSGVTLTSSFPAATVSVVPPTLTFAPLSFSTPQTVTVSGVDDSVFTFPAATALVLLTATSSDPNYLISSNGLFLLDDDDPGFIGPSVSALTVDEEHGEGTLTFTLNVAPVSDVTIKVSVDDPLAAAVSTDLVFSALNFSDLQTVTVTGLPDDVDTERTVAIMFNCTSTFDPTYPLVSIDNATLHITDDDTAALLGPFPTLAVVEGDGSTQTVAFALATEPLADVTIELASEAPLSLSASPTTLTFQPATWMSLQTATLTGLAGSGVSVNTHLSCSARSSDAAYHGLSANAMAVTVVSTVLPEIMVTTNHDMLGLAEGEAATIAVVLATVPSAAVTVNVASDNVDIGTVHPPTFVFSTDTWNSSAVFTISAVDDDLDLDEDGFFTVALSSLSSDSAYSRAALGSVTQTVADNDNRPGWAHENNGSTVLSPPSTIVAVPGRPTPLPVLHLDQLEVDGSYLVSWALIGDPDGAVFVDNHADIASVQGNGTTVMSFTVPPASVEAVSAGVYFVLATDVTFGAQGVSLHLAIDDAPDSLTLDHDIAIEVTRGISFVLGSGSTTLVENGNLLGTYTGFSVEVTCESAPTAPVLISAVVDPPGTVVGSGQTTTFTPLAYQFSRTFEFSAPSVDVVDSGSMPWTVSFFVQSDHDTRLDGGDVPQWSLDGQTFDTDHGGVIIEGQGVAMEGAFGSDSSVVRVQLLSSITETTTVQLAIADDGSADDCLLLDPTFATFFPITSSVPATVRVAAVDNSVADSPGCTIVVASISPPLPDGESPPFPPVVTIPIEDDDDAGIIATSQFSENELVVVEGAQNATLTLRLASEPRGTGVVTVPVSAGARTVVHPAALTFVSANFSNQVTVTVTAIDDLAMQGNTTHAIVVGPAVVAPNETATAYGRGQSWVAGSVTVVDNDHRQLLVAGCGSIMEGHDTVLYLWATAPLPTDRLAVRLSLDYGPFATNVSSFFMSSSSPVPILLTTVNDNVDRGYGRWGNAPETQLRWSMVSPLTDWQTTGECSLTPVEDDEAAVVLLGDALFDTPKIRVLEGATGTIGLRLASEPIDSVTIVTSGDDLRIGLPDALVITAESWSNEHPIAVSAVDDNLITGLVSFDVTVSVSSTDNAYSRVGPQTFSVVVVDNDGSAVQHSTSVQVPEGGQADFWLAHAPSTSASTTSVSLTVSKMADWDENEAPFAFVPTSTNLVTAFSPSAMTLELSPGDFVVLRLEGTDDDVARTSVLAGLSISSSAGSARVVDVVVVDNDEAHMSLGISPESPSATTDEAGTEMVLRLSFATRPVAPIEATAIVSPGNALEVVGDATATLLPPAAGTAPYFIDFVVRGLRSGRNHDGPVSANVSCIVNASPNSTYRSVPSPAPLVLSVGEKTFPFVQNTRPFASTDGGKAVILHGAGFLPGLQVFVGGELANPDAYVLSDEIEVGVGPADRLRAAKFEYTTLEFEPPPSAPGYKNVMVVNPDGGVTEFDELLYFAEGDCIELDVVSDPITGECNKCPAGAICPGGDRIVPKPGYWTPSETAGYVEPCSANPDACPGGASQACADGYMGAMCTACEPGRFEEHNLCLPCGTDTHRDTMLSTLGMTFAVVVLGFVLTMFFATDRMLDDLFVGIVAVQILSAASKTGTPSVSAIARVGFSVLATSGFDISIVRMHCFQSSIDALTIYMVQLGVLVAITIPLAIGLPIVATLRGRSDYRRQVEAKTENPEPRIDFAKPMTWARARFTRAVWMLATLSYLTVSSATLCVVYCAADGGGTVRLVNKPDITCYEGTHLPVAVVAWILIFCYVLFFPFAVLVFLRVRLNGERNDLFRRKYGFLFECFHSHWYLSILAVFGIFLAIAIGATFFTTSPIARLLVITCPSGVILLYIQLASPFRTPWQNSVVVSAFVLQIFGFAVNFVASGPADDVPSSLPVLSICVFAFAATLVVAIAVLLGRSALKNRAAEYRPESAPKEGPAIGTWRSNDGRKSVRSERTWVSSERTFRSSSDVLPFFPDSESESDCTSVVDSRPSTGEGDARFGVERAFEAVEHGRQRSRYSRRKIGRRSSRGPSTMDFLSADRPMPLPAPAYVDPMTESDKEKESDREKEKDKVVEETAKDDGQEEEVVALHTFEEYDEKLMQQELDALLDTQAEAPMPGDEFSLVPGSTERAGSVKRLVSIDSQFDERLASLLSMGSTSVPDEVLSLATSENTEQQPFAPPHIATLDFAAVAEGDSDDTTQLCSSPGSGSSAPGLVMEMHSASDFSESLP